MVKTEPQQLDIVQVSAYYPPHLGGQENAVRNLSNALANSGQSVRVVTSDQGASAGTVNEGMVKVARLKSFEFAHMAIIWNLFWWLLKNTNKRTVVHLHIGQAYTPEMVWLASRFKRFNYIAHMHIEPQQSGSMGVLLPIYKQYFLGRALRAASTIFVLNNQHKAVMRDTYDCTQPVIIMNNGIDEDFFNVVRSVKRNSSKPFRLLFVGRLSPQKNLPTLIKALSKCDVPVRLEIAGDGECRHEIEECIAKHNMNNISLLGALSRDEILSLYASVDMLVLPSLYEAQPLVLLEAMAAKVPILGTNVMGIAEHIRGSGIIAEPTTESLASSIEYAYGHTSELKQLSDISYKKALRLKWSVLTKKYLDAYEKDTYTI